LTKNRQPIHRAHPTWQPPKHAARQIRQPLDVFLSHDWPQWITKHGDAAALFRKKPYFQKEVRGGVRECVCVRERGGGRGSVCVCVRVCVRECV